MEKKKELPKALRLKAYQYCLNNMNTGRFFYPASHALADYLKFHEKLKEGNKHVEILKEMLPEFYLCCNIPGTKRIPSTFEDAIILICLCIEIVKEKDLLTKKKPMK